MFRKKKLYKFTYRTTAAFGIHSLIIEGVDEIEAAKIFRKHMNRTLYDVISIEEFNVGRG